MHRAEVGAEHEFQPVGVLLDQRPHRSRHVAHHRLDLEVLAVQFHLAGLDLRQVEDVVDQRQQVLAGGVNPLEIGDEPLLARVLGVLLQHLAVADDGVERRPQLVAHVRQELTLGAVCVLGALPRAQQLADVVVQPHQPHALAVHIHRNGQYLDVHEAAVLAAALPDAVYRVVRCLLGVRDRLGPRLLGGDQVVQVLTDHFLLGVTVQLLERRVDGDDVVFRVERHDGDRVVAHQLREVLLLPPRRRVEPRVLDRYGRLRREQVEEAQVLGAEVAVAVGMPEVDGADEPATDHQR